MMEDKHLIFIAVDSNGESNVMHFNEHDTKYRKFFEDADGIDNLVRGIAEAERSLIIIIWDDWYTASVLARYDGRTNGRHTH